MANEGLCEVMSVEQASGSAQQVPSADDLKSIAATWQQTAKMSAAGQLCSIEVKTSQNSSSIHWKTSDDAPSESSQGTAGRVSSVIVPRRTLKIATGQRAKAVCAKMANQTTRGAGSNALADTVESNPVASSPGFTPAETLLPSEVPELPLAEHRV